MEKKNMVLLTVIAVATLLVAVVGATFAYFSTASQNAFNGGTTGAGNTNVTSGTVSADNDTIIIAETDANAGSFTASNVYPGHKEVAGASVTAKSSSGISSNIKISYVVNENTFTEGVKISLYKSTTKTTVSSNYFQCSQTATGSGAEIHYSENCTGTIPADWTQVGTTQNVVGTTDLVLAASEKLNATDAGSTVYYYVVVEFAETGAEQNSLQGKTLDGQIKFEII